jgi:hypothetical protein
MAGDGILSRYDDPSNYTGGYPPDWDARRGRVYRRDDYTCRHCGRQSGPHSNDDVRLHAHHQVPKSAGGSNRLDNLVTLCESCHNRAHDHDITQSMSSSGTSTSSGTVSTSGSGTTGGTGTTAAEGPSMALEGVLFLTYPLYLLGVLTLVAQTGLLSGEELPLWVAAGTVGLYALCFAYYPARALRIGGIWVALYLGIQVLFARWLLPSPTTIGTVVVGIGPPLAVLGGRRLFGTD